MLHRTHLWTNMKSYENYHFNCINRIKSLVKVKVKFTDIHVRCGYCVVIYRKRCKINRSLLGSRAHSMDWQLFVAFILRTDVSKEYGASRDFSARVELLVPENCGTAVHFVAVSDVCDKKYR